MWNEISITVLRRVRLLVALFNSTLVINTCQIHTYVACLPRAMIKHTRPRAVDRKLAVWTMPHV